MIVPLLPQTPTTGKRVHEEQVQVSVLSWIYYSLGPLYTPLLPLSGLIAFLVVLVLVFRGKGPFAVGAIILVTSTPGMIGVFGAFHGVIASFQVVAMAGVQPDSREIVIAVTTSIMAPFVGMFCMGPAFVAALVGTMVRSFADSQQEKFGVH